MNAKGIAKEGRAEAGARFGRWTLVERDYGRRYHYWWCVCDCGGKKSVAFGSLRRGVSRSCGCYNRDAAKRRPANHGMAGSATYNVWASMIQRCRNPRAASFRNYGARGISVCERWHDFREFLRDMGDVPAGRSIDRIDVNGNYEPGNCRWVTMREQQRNRTNNKLSAESVAVLRAEISRGVVTKKALAQKYGISAGYVSHIEHRRAWKEIEPSEFHRDYPDATADQYVRFKHVAASAAGVLIGHSEK